MHWDHEPLAVRRQMESADKSDALQALCAVRRRPAVAKRLECVRLQHRFPKPGYDSMTGPVHGKDETTSDGRAAMHDQDLHERWLPMTQVAPSLSWQSSARSMHLRP